MRDYMCVHRDRDLEVILEKTLDSGDNIWVIGDIHGQFLTLKKLISKLNLGENDKIISLGDLIDRGPDSSSVLQLFHDDSMFHFIRGNHEDMMINCLRQNKDNFWESWFRKGGLQTMESFGKRWDEQIEDWCYFLSTSPSEIVLKKYRLIHAGVNPLKSLDDQNEEDRLWSRDIFKFNSAPDPERQIFIGHTPTQTIEGHRTPYPWRSEFTTKDNRPAIINVDTGVCLEKKYQPTLTAVCINSGQVIQVRREH